MNSDWEFPGKHATWDYVVEYLKIQLIIKDEGS
jgi:hypothetical protein